jgi:MerC mercury resistance protein
MIYCIDSSMSQLFPPRIADLSALGLSGLCLVHCVLGTLAIGAAATGALGGALVHGSFHLITLLLAALLAGWAIAREWRLHQDMRVPLLAVAGLALMAGGLMLHGHGHLEALVTGGGVILLSLAHLANLHFGRRARLAR